MSLTISGAANRATLGCIWPLCHGGIKNPAHVTRGQKKKKRDERENKSLYIVQKSRKPHFFLKITT